jgi:predicted metal-binding protein
VRYWKGTVSLERHLFLHGYDKAFSLVSGSCSLCKECAYPAACRFPTEKRPTIESLAVDVIGTLKNLGIDTKVARDPKELFKYYAVILLV